MMDYLYVKLGLQYICIKYMYNKYLKVIKSLFWEKARHMGVSGVHLTISSYC